MTSDCELLRHYVEDKSEPAFAELVRRHLDLVYSAALRQVNGDAQLAQDVAQMVFSDLARKAGSLAGRPALSGWLYTSAHFAASKAVRGERRRRVREQEAQTMQDLLRDPGPEPGWDKLRPMLDQVMYELKEADREVVLLRYFESRPFADIGARFGVGEDAARMRVDRALEKLRGLLVRRGMNSTTAALAVILTQQTITAAPAGLAAGITATALAGTALAPGITFTLLKSMALPKLKLVTLSVMVIAGITTSLILQQQAQARWSAAEGRWRRQAESLTQLTEDNRRLSGTVTQAMVFEGNQQRDLQRLRAEADRLRGPAGELAVLQAENQRLRQRIPLWHDPSKTALQSREEARARMSFAKDWVAAFRNYAEDHQGQFPPNFDAAAAYVSDRLRGETNILTDEFEMVFHGKQEELPPDVIVLRQKQALRSGIPPMWFKAYGFADGHSESHSGKSEIESEAETNFAQFERDRMLSPTPANQ